ncbi:MAG: GIY-YIG nuclease family protein [Opitutaceae bacterium]|nr:GIY-YIG nuclease family protein [Opitutaceae bacterium]
MYFVYILVCLESGRTYVGQTDNLIRRFRLHREGSTRTTRERLLAPVVIHWEAFGTRTEAIQRERFFKAGVGHRRKCELVRTELKAWFGLG